MKTLIENISEIYTADQTNKVFKDAYMIIDDQRIKEIGPTNQLKGERAAFDRIINGKNKMVLPGLINSHTHTAMTLLRGYADDLPLRKWLEEKIWPFEAKLSADDIYWGSMLAILEMLSSGTTTFTDMYFQMDRVAEAVTETGIRAVLSEGLIEANDGAAGLKSAQKFSQDYHQQADGRITTMLAPHSPYTCSTHYLKEIVEISAMLHLPLNIHVAETKVEYEESKRKHGLSPVKYLDKIGLLERPVLAAHCVYVDQEEIDILAEKGVGVAYNPCSNMKLASGIAPVVRMLEAGVAVGLGTDGVSSNNNLDLIEEARFGSYLQKVNQLDPTTLNVLTLLNMVTASGAEILRIKELGRLKKGYLADLIMVDLNKSSYFYPAHNNLSNLFFAGNGRDVSTVIINGELIIDNYNILTIDQERVYYEIEQIIANNC
ncbi:MAG: amidohydrolase [Halanaerobiales bacterium]|nr:amidohydrolase [Halanaerobiales bacterium]